MRTLTALLPLALLACGGGSTDKAAAPPMPPAATDATPSAAESSELRIYEADTLIMVLAPDGSLTIVPAGDQVVGTLSADNTITVAGRTATLAADGVVAVDGEPTGYSIGPDASLHGPGVPPVKLEPDGTISGQSAGARPLRVEGATTAELRRKAMFLLLLATMSTDDVDDRADAAEPPPPAESPSPGPGGGEDEGKMGGNANPKKDKVRRPPAPTGGDGAVDDM